MMSRSSISATSVLGPLTVLVASLVEVLLAVPAHQAVLEDRRAALPALLRICPGVARPAYGLVARDEKLNAVEGQVKHCR